VLCLTDYSGGLTGPHRTNETTEAAFNLGQNWRWAFRRRHAVESLNELDYYLGANVEFL